MGRFTVALIFCVVTFVLIPSLGQSYSSSKHTALSELKVVRHDILDVEKGGSSPSDQQKHLVAQLITFKAKLSESISGSRESPELLCSENHHNRKYITTESSLYTNDGVYGRDFWNRQGFMFIHPNASIVGSKDGIKTNVIRYFFIWHTA